LAFRESMMRIGFGVNHEQFEAFLSWRTVVEIDGSERWLRIGPGSSFQATILRPSLLNDSCHSFLPLNSFPTVNHDCRKRIIQHQRPQRKQGLEQLQSRTHFRCHCKCLTKLRMNGWSNSRMNRQTGKWRMTARFTQSASNTMIRINCLRCHSGLKRAFHRDHIRPNFLRSIAVRFSGLTISDQFRFWTAFERAIPTDNTRFLTVFWLYDSSMGDNVRLDKRMKCKMILKGDAS
jgi:hypothetical protein